MAFELDKGVSESEQWTTACKHKGIKQKLNDRGLLLCNGIFFHVRCGAHILNLIFQEELKVIDDLVIKIRETMKYLKGSESRMCRFDECAKIVGMKRTKSLRLDVCTRWTCI